ncbi:MAG TPA: DUF6049 family protein [Nocardioidaceae bacterium]|nr:DUF6049 family protein [Nocardioidaceae bacterium]
MTRRPLHRAALCALVLLVTVLVLSATATEGAEAAERPAEEAAGRVTIRHIQPTSLQVGRPIQLSGVVRNTTDEVWSEVQVSALISESPVTTRENLADVRADREALALRQVLAPGDFQDLGDLAPGTESTFTLRNSWKNLPITGASGAYVVGVEVRAFLEDGLRNTVADTTTFVPLVTPETSADRVDLAMLWPLTAAVPRAESGYVNRSLQRQLAAGGRLSELTELGAGAGDFPLTWVVDPAVLDAARDMSDGFELVARAAAPADAAETVPADDVRALAADSWLSATLSALADADVLTLPYGDPDAASLAHGRLPGALTPAAAAATSTLEELEIPQQSVLWPAHGWIDRRTRRAASRISPTLTLIATDSVRGSEASTVVALGTGDHPGTGVTYPRRAVSPREGETMLQWRQQLLAVTALRAMDGGGPLVVVPPRDLTPDPNWDDGEFFTGLRGSWLRPRPLSELTQSPARPAQLRYPRVARRRELPPENLDAIRDLMAARDTLVGVLADPTSSQQRLAEAIGIASSVHWRDQPELGELLTRSYVDSVRDRLDEIVVEAPSFITLSGEEGRFPVTVSNGLDDQAITVSVDVDASNDALEIQPIEPVTIEPRQRRSIPVQVSYTGVGISNVTVRMLDRTGAEFGDPVVLKVRTTQIGAVIWVVMAIGGIIILAAAARSVVRRVRRRGTGPDDPSTDPSVDTTGS